MGEWRGQETTPQPEKQNLILLVRHPRLLSPALVTGLTAEGACPQAVLTSFYGAVVQIKRNPTL